MSELGFSMEVDPGRKPKDPEKRGRGAVVLAVVVFGAVLAVIAGLLLKDRIFPSGGEDYSGAGTGEVTVQVKQGETLADIGATLKENGVVASVQSFIDAAAANPQAQAIGPGYYSLSEKMSAQAALERLLDPGSQVIKRVVVPEGLRRDQVVKALSRGTGIPQPKFNAALKNATELGLPKWAKGNPEGFLFPATYEFPPDAKANDILTTMFDRFHQAAADLDLMTRAKKTGYTPYEVMIIASIAQAEGHPGDYAKVTRTIYNRLAIGMPLQMDSTLNYTLKKSKINLTEDQLAVASPYNTYLNPGLPPTPINQPGEEAIKATLEPAEGDWLYFVSVNPDTGETKFTSDYNEFLKYKAEFEKWLAENPQ